MPRVVIASLVIALFVQNLSAAETDKPAAKAKVSAEKAPAVKPAAAKAPQAKAPAAKPQAKPATKPAATSPAAADTAKAKPAAKAEAKKAVPPVVETERWLPADTRGFISVANAVYFDAQWKATQVGQLMNDPVMEPFSRDLRRQLENRLSNLRDRLGLTLDDLRDLPSGDVTVAATQPGEGQAAMVVLMDVSGRLDKAQAMLEKTTAHQLRRGGQQQTVPVGEDAITAFSLPPVEDDPRPRQAAYFLVNNRLGAADNVELLRGVLTRLRGGNAAGSLAAEPAFRAIMKRCQADAAGATPHLRWFVNPLGYAEVMRAATPEAERRKGKTVVSVLKNQGFAGLQGIGGFVELKVDRYELLHRTAVYAPGPFTKSMKMLVLPNATEFKPQSWVPRDIASYSTFHFDILGAFDNFGPLFDELFGEQGETGIWTDVVQSLKDDPNGPRLDLRKDLIGHLGKRISILADYKTPITVDSERTLYAIETSNEQAVAAAIGKWMQNDPTAQKRETDGRVIWEIVEQEMPEMPKIDLESIPAIPNAEPPRPSKGRRTLREEEEEGARLLPHAAVTVAHGHLLIASHYDFLMKVLAKLEERKTLARDIDFRKVQGVLETAGMKERCAEVFSRIDEEYRPTYELIRQNRMPEGETTLARVLNALAGNGAKGHPRKQQLDGSRLPDFEVVRRYLGSAGAVAQSEASGWFIRGFALTKEEQ